MFIYNPKVAHSPLSDVRAYAILTSKTVVTLLLLSLGIEIVLLLLALMTPTSSHELGLILLLGSSSAAIFLSFLFGATFFPYNRKPTRPADLLSSLENHNLALAADFLLIHTLRNKQTTEEIFAALINSSATISICRRLQLSREDLETAIRNQVLPFVTLSQFAYHATNIAANGQATSVSLAHALGVFLLHTRLQPYLRQAGLKQDDIHFLLWWQVAQSEILHRARSFWLPQHIRGFSGIGLSWAAGFTPLLDRFRYIPTGNLWDTAYGRQEEVGELINTLARSSESNVLLIGAPGVGRLGVVKEVVRRIENNQAHPALRHQRVAYVHLGQLLALGKSGPAQLEFIARALDEMERAGNIIAVLDGLGSLLGSTGDQGMNITDVLQPFFSSHTVRVVVIMSVEEYHLRLKNNDELLHLFEVVQIAPLLPHATLELLAVTVPAWEKQQRLFVPYQTLRSAVSLTAGIMPHIPFPEKAFDVLEEAAVKVQGEGKTIIEPADIESLITRKVGVPVGKIIQQEAQRLLSLEDFIHKRVVNQVQAVGAVSRAMIRARAGVRNENRPIGTFLFLGPTGVGKTETAKALAESYFGAEEYLKRFDMSEFQTEDAISRLIGDTSHPVGRLTSLISDHPFCVLLLDEFEKADLSVQQLFLQVFDEGRLSDAVGREYSFRHAIMIATSNAGAEFIRQNIGEKGSIPDDFEAQLREHLLQKGIFRPELLNRFDGVITFTPLSEAHIREVARLMLKKLNKRLDASQGVTVKITNELIDFLITIGFNPEFGARPMNRAIQNTVEYAIAQRALKGQLNPGQEVELHAGELRII